MFTIQNKLCSKNRIEECTNSLKQYGIHITAASLALACLKGSIVKVHSENDNNKVTINISIPLITGDQKIDVILMHISDVPIQESLLTIKWNPVEIKNREINLDEFNMTWSKKNEDFTENTLVCCDGLGFNPLKNLWSDSLSKEKIDYDKNFENNEIILKSKSEVVEIQEKIVKNLKIPIKNSENLERVLKISENLEKILKSSENLENISEISLKSIETLEKTKENYIIKLSLLIIDSDMVSFSNFSEKWILKHVLTPGEGLDVYKAYTNLFARFTVVFINTGLIGFQDFITSVKDFERERYYKTFICGIALNIERTQEVYFGLDDISK